MSGLIYDAIMEIEASITSRLFYHQHFFLVLLNCLLRALMEISSLYFCLMSFHKSGTINFKRVKFKLLDVKKGAFWY